ncbi:MAG: type I glyceraldehyde-3-phosphate dehydrogenase [Proteobacteria bacterium]|nr:type I glyceraldehyde-3-phosphate dehydrogenase [Pseudomonadota bacterium]
MKTNVAVNGYGRVGRCVVRALYESEFFSDRIRVVAINELAELKTIYHLTKYDSTHGRFSMPVDFTENGLVVGRDSILVLNEESPEMLPWKELNVDVVLECTGSYTDRPTAEKHLESGAGKLIFSQPADHDADATIVYGINHHLLKPEHTVISNASCTTNCIIPILHTLDRALGIYKGTVTTIHSAMHDQPIIDAYNSDLRKTRSAIQSIIPVSTELNKGIERIIPSLKDRFETLAIRVPTTNVSLMDANILVEKDTSADQINEILQEAADGSLKGILGYTDEQLVSCDFNHDPRSSIVDCNQTRVSGTRLVKVLTWFDNEWGYANRMLDTTLAAVGAE